MIYNDATQINQLIRSREITATELIQSTLTQIAKLDVNLNCFTQVLRDQALLAAQHIDDLITIGDDPGLLAGVPFALKNLFDVARIPTLAGSKINADDPPALIDAPVIRRLTEAGGINLGTLNMDEYAYGFVTENYHYGTTRNPHDLTRIAGGSSGGSAAAVAGGLVPFSLGTDTNGSVRVPAALCGVYGFKPTFGKICRDGMQLLAESLDHVGYFARSVRDLILIYRVLTSVSGFDDLDQGITGIKIAIADQYYQTQAEPEALAVVEQVAQLLPNVGYITIAEADRARAAAYIITASERSRLHLNKLRTRLDDFDPATRDRLVAGTLIPDSWYLKAQEFRRWYRIEVDELFKQVDLILAPTTPIVAPLIGQKTMIIDGEEMLIRPNLGRFTQPLSLIGLPVLSIPIHRPDQLPLGVQLIAAPDRESIIFRVAAYLEQQGITGLL